MHRRKTRRYFTASSLRALSRGGALRLLLLVTICACALGIAFGHLPATSDATPPSSHPVVSRTRPVASPHLVAPAVKPAQPSIHAVSLDPADYLSVQHDASALARTLVARFARSGVNLIYINAYNVQYGAYYQTSYRYNSENEYGRQDLLGKLITAAHARGIQVFAAFYDHQHRGAWEQNPSWRAERQNGSAYNPPGVDVQYYLSIKNAPAAHWWRGFIGDILHTYPNLDGIELREPIINWWGTEADHNPAFDAAFARAYPHSPLNGSDWIRFRSQSLTAFLKAETHIIHAADRLVHVTTVADVHPSGAILTNAEESADTGFDAKALMRGPDRPDAIKVEFIWQQWANVYGFVSFTPEWTRRAAEAYLKATHTTGRMIAHVELTDFGRSGITADEFYRTLRYADVPGAIGLDFYSAALADKKHAWPAIAAVYKKSALPLVVPRDKRVLILYDNPSGSSAVSLAKIDATFLANLLGHFDVKWEVRPVNQYRRGDLDGFSYVFYQGTEYGNAPQAFLSDVSVFQGHVIWIGQNLFELKNSGVQLPFRQSTQLSHFNKGRVSYKGQSLVASGETIPTRPARGTKTWVTMRTHAASLPYILQAGKFWYVAGSPFVDIDPSNGRYLAFADLLHNMLGIPATSPRRAFLRVEDVTPLTDPVRLRALTDEFYSRHVPFMVAVIAVYVDPSNHQRVALSERPRVAAALRYMESHGGTIIVHGYTHQTTGRSGADYEFWNLKNQTGLQNDSETLVRGKVENALAEIWKCGLHPLAWETPHYAATSYDYSVFGDYFSTFVEQRSYGVFKNVSYTQSDPYLIKHDVNGATLVPENLGYLPEGRFTDISAIIAHAKALTTVRDAIAGGFIHPRAPVAVTGRVIAALKGMGYQFLDLRTLPNVVQTDGRAEVSGSASTSLVVPSGDYLAVRRFSSQDRVITDQVTQFVNYGRPSVHAQATGISSYQALTPAEYKALNTNKSTFGHLIDFSLASVIVLIGALAALLLCAGWLYIRAGSRSLRTKVSV